MIQRHKFLSLKPTYIFQKIKQLELEVGCYFQKEPPIPQESLALYITVNPRDMRKATMNTAMQLVRSVRDENIIMNPHQEALSEIQKTKSRTCYVDFDIDIKEEDTLTKIKNLTDGMFDETVPILETRGGYHVLIDPTKVKPGEKNSWYKTLNLGFGADQVGDQMIPLPGTYQGGFTPKFVQL